MVLKSFQKFSPKLFTKKTNQFNTLNNRVYLIFNLVQEISSQSKTNNLIHIKRNFFNSYLNIFEYKIQLEIEYIQKNAFGIFKDLVALDLCDNELVDFDLDAFQNLVKLESLDLSNNKLLFLPVNY